MSPGNPIFVYWDKTKTKKMALGREAETERYEEWFLCGLHQQCSCGVWNYSLKSELSSKTTVRTRQAGEGLPLFRGDASKVIGSVCRILMKRA